MCLGRGCWWSPRHTSGALVSEAWVLCCAQPGSRLEGGLPSPPPCPGPARPGSRNQDGAEWMLPVYGRAEGPDPPPVAHLFQALPPRSLLLSGPLLTAALFQGWGLGCTEDRGGRGAEQGQ